MSDVNPDPRLLLETLTDEHDVSSFECGEESMDAWLRNAARTGQRSGMSQTHVWARPDRTVCGYFSIAPTSVIPDGLSTRERGRGDKPLPGYLLAKLALASDLRGQSPPIGPLLLIDALTTIVEAADRVGGRLVVVDALNEAAHRFYQSADFRPIEGTNRLVAKVSTVRSALRP